MVSVNDGDGMKIENIWATFAGPLLEQVESEIPDLAFGSPHP